MANRFIGGVLSSQQPSNGGFVSRASTGTYISSAGVLQTAPINQPRISYTNVNGTWTNPTLLIEPAATNLFASSVDLSNTSFWQNPFSITVSGNSITSPDGTSTACAATIVSGTSSFIRYNILTGFTNNTVYTFSVWAKIPASGGATNIRLTTNNTAAWSTGVGSVNALSTTWQRFSVTGVIASGNTNAAYFMIGNVDTADNLDNSCAGVIHLWGAQLEVGAKMTSYIYTTGTTASRSQDDMGPVGSGVYRLEEMQQQSSIDDQYTIQSFTTVGNSTWTAPADVTSVELAIVAGGGAGADNGAGGGGGGVIYTPGYSVVPGQTYNIIVGAGAPSVTAGSNTIGTNGGNSQFGSLIALGGGFGGSGGGSAQGGQGGSGGGCAALLTSTTLQGGSGTPGQGFKGGNSYGGVSPYPAGGGGGAGGPAGPAGGTTTSSYNMGGAGGVGLYLPQFNAYGSSGYFGGGGGGGGNIVTSYGAGGTGGGGSATAGLVGTKAGTANTGGGGGGGVGLTGGGAGGSGIVLIRFKRTNTQLSAPSNVSTVSQKFITSNYWTCPQGVTQVETLVVAGGGGGGSTSGGGGSGGGAGGLLYNAAMSVTPGTTYQLVVGAGGAGGNSSIGSNGYPSAFAGSTEYNTNYSFVSTTGWSAQASATVATTTGNGPNGGNVIALTSSGGSNIYSTYLISGLTNGTQYIVSFWIKGSTSFNSGTVSFTDNAYNSGTTLVTATSYAVTTNWVQYSYIFTANSNANIYVSVFTGGTNTNVFFMSQLSVRATVMGAIGGGGGGTFGNAGASGGSGGGGTTSVGSGTSGQGNLGGIGYNWPHTNSNGSGGGAGSPGFPAGVVDAMGSGNGGSGLPFTITGNLEWYAGGGGGGTYALVGNAYGSIPGAGGIGGGGAGAFGGYAGSTGSPNTGGGGGGGGGNGQTTGAAGGSGVIILRYRVPTVAVFQDSGYWTCPAGVTNVQALVIAGGGGGGALGGGGGAGGLVYSNSIPVVPGNTYPVVIGQGGLGSVNLSYPGSNGYNSSFNNLIAYGGGGGGSNASNSSWATGITGGSGGGMGSTGTSNTANNIGGSGIPGQGNGGGAGNVSSPYPAAGGAGAGAGGGNSSSSTSGGGGTGLTFSISGTAVNYAGGGSGGWRATNGGTGTAPATGFGGGIGSSNDYPASPGWQNTGGGAGGGGYVTNGGFGGQGGSGTVIIRWYGG